MTEDRIFKFGIGLVVSMLALSIATYVALHKGHKTDQHLAAVIQGIQVERGSNTVKACQTTNREHRAIIGFIEFAIPADERHNPQVIAYLQRARQTFPLLGGATTPATDRKACEAYAKTRVKMPQP